MSIKFNKVAGFRIGILQIDGVKITTGFMGTDTGDIAIKTAIAFFTINDDSFHDYTSLDA